VILGIVAIIFIIIIVGAAFIFILPNLPRGGDVLPNVTLTATVTPETTARPSGTFVIPVETTPPAVPPTGVYVHISYIGGWKGSYGTPDARQSVADSGDRFYEVENATGTVDAFFEKLDASTRHALVVEIYKNGGLLAKGQTSEAFGKVTVSADSTKGAVIAPVATTVITAKITAPATNTTPAA
jgi:hypothetical protein